VSRQAKDTATFFQSILRVQDSPLWEIGASKNARASDVEGRTVAFPRGNFAETERIHERTNERTEGVAWCTQSRTRVHASVALKEPRNERERERDVASVVRSLARSFSVSWLAPSCCVQRYITLRRSAASPRR